MPDTVTVPLTMGCQNRPCVVRCGSEPRNTAIDPHGGFSLNFAVQRRLTRAKVAASASAMSAPKRWAKRSAKLGLTV